MSGKLPKGWTLAPISELVGPDGLMCDGDWVESKDQDPDGEVRLIQLADVGIGVFLNKSSRFLTSEKARSLGCTFLRAGDVLIARLGERLGKSCTFPEFDQRCVTVVDVHVFRAGSAGVSHRWLMHFMNSPSTLRSLEAQSSGTTRKRITGQKIKDLGIPVPPAREQKAIASMIDKLLSRIADGERSLERARVLLERYRQSVLKAAVTGELTRGWREKHKGEPEPGETLLGRVRTARREAWERDQLAVFQERGIVPPDDSWRSKYQEPIPPMHDSLPPLPIGWVWSTIGQVGLVSGGLTKNPDRATGELVRPYLRVANVHANRLDLEDIARIGLSYGELPRVLLRKGDLLVVEGNGSLDQIGRVALWDGSIEGCVHQNHVIKVRLPDELWSWYALVWCMSPMGRRFIQDVASSTAGLHTLSISKVENLPLPVPRQGELQRIRSAFESAEALVQEQQRAVERGSLPVAALRQSILHAAFTGRLVPQDTNDEPASVLLERIAAERAAAKPATKPSRSKRNPRK